MVVGALKSDFFCVPAPNKLVDAGMVVVVESDEPNKGLAEPNNPPDVVAVLVGPNLFVVSPVQNNPPVPNARNFLFA